MTTAISDRPAKRQILKDSLRETFQHIVEVKVGGEENQESFPIHETHLRGESAFFRAAMSDAWKEAKTGVITLPEEDPDIFAIFFGWLSTGLLSLEAVYGPQKPEEKAQVALSIILLGDKLGIKAFHDKGIDLIVESLVDTLPTAELVHRAYDKASMKAPIHKLLIRVTLNRLETPFLARQFFTSLPDYHFSFGLLCFLFYFIRTQGSGSVEPEEPSIFYMKEI